MVDDMRATMAGGITGGGEELDPAGDGCKAGHERE
jgi:hypothetical protein